MIRSERPFVSCQLCRLLLPLNEGSLPPLNRAVAFSPDGKTLASASGDNTVKNEVISRYVKVDTEPHDVAITPDNYKFKYKGTQDWNNRQVYVLQLKPREKKVGLFKGELWLDAETYMPVREQGSFVKSPSFMLKKMQFVRDYELQNGVSIPQRTESRVETRFFGQVELNINYLTFSKDTARGGADDAEAVAETNAVEQQ